MYHRFTLTTTSLLFSLTAAHAAPGLNDYAGNYTALAFDLPARLVETYYNTVTMETRQTFDAGGSAGPDEQLVDVFFPEEPEPLTVDLTFTSDGGVSGLPGGGASVTATPNGRLQLNLGDGDKALFYPLPNLGLMFAMDQDEDSQQFIPLVRRSPAAPAAAEFNGEWQYVALVAPRTLREVYYNTVTDETRTSVDSQDAAGENEILVDTFLTVEPEIIRLDAVFSGGSTVSGDIVGTFAVDGEGRVVLTIDGDAAVFQPTPDRNVMVGLQAGDTEQELGFLVRKGSAPVAADLAGSWRFFSLSNASTLRETFFNPTTEATRVGANSQDFALEGEQLVDLDGGEAEIEIGAINFHADGTASGAASGSFSISPEGRLLFEDADNTLDFVISAGNDLLVTAGGSEDQVSLVVVIREPRLELTRSGDTLNIGWGGTTSGTLQKSSDNLNSWQDVGPVAPNATINETIQSTGAVHYRIQPE